MRRNLVLAVTLTAAAAAVLAAAIAVRPGAGAAAQDGEARDVAAAAVPVTVVVARQSSGYRVESRYAGRVVARRTSALGFARSGILTWVGVEDGDRVEAGALLALLDTRLLEARVVELQAELDHGRAMLAAATARSDQSTALAKRRASLARNDFVSQESYDDAQFGQKMALAERDAAESALRSAKAALDTLHVELDLSRLTAPYAGTIVARRRDEGAVVASGEAVLEIAETDHVELRVGVPVAVAATLTPGNTYRGVVAGRAVDCRLHRIVPTVDPETRTVTAVLTLPPGGRPPRSGELGQLAVDREVAAAGFWLPLAALTESRRGLWAAFVVEAGAGDGEGDGEGAGVLSQRTLQLVQVDGDRAYVTGVLRDGEWVVADGVHRLVPGQRVTPVATGPGDAG